MESLRNILIVDDETGFLSSMKRLLRKEAFGVLTAEDGESALAVIKSQDVSVMVVDYMMPGMDGIDLLRRVRRDWPELVCIMITGHCRIDIALEAINELGIYKFFPKPVNPLELLASIHNALGNLGPELRLIPSIHLKSREACLKAWELDCPGITKFEADGEIEFLPPR